MRSEGGQMEGEGVTVGDLNLKKQKRKAKCIERIISREGGKKQFNLFHLEFPDCLVSYVVKPLYIAI